MKLGKEAIFDNLSLLSLTADLHLFGLNFRLVHKLIPQFGLNRFRGSQNDGIFFVLSNEELFQ